VWFIARIVKTNNADDLDGEGEVGRQERQARDYDGKAGKGVETLACRRPM
jgi:hypothetical protein